MSWTDNIINTALLGTGSRELTVSDFPEELQDTLQELKEKTSDTEDAFYQMAALGIAYSRGGALPQEGKEYSGIEAAEADHEDYFSREAGELLLSLITNRNPHLLLYAYHQAARCGKLIRPNSIQALLSRAFDSHNPSRKEEQRLLAGLTGNRARWLLPFMELPSWGAKDEICWETASHEERKQLLSETRRENPDEGLALLRTELKNESAPHREELIQCLQEKLNKNDEPFLLDVIASDRSSNVKDTARELLCCLPDSGQVQYYWGLLKGKLHYNILLGWSYDKLEFTPEMKQMGLSEVSSVKNEKDDQFLLRQLAERVPLAFWCECFNCEPEKAAVKLVKHPPFQNFFQLWKPIQQFKDSNWAYYTLKEKTEEYHILNLMGLLSPEQREEIAFRTEGKDMYIPEDWYNEDRKTWGIKFSAYVLGRLLTRNYMVSKEEVEQTAVYFPDDMLSRIEQKLTVLNDRESVASRICQMFLDYMNLKQRIDTLFNDKN